MKDDIRTNSQVQALNANEWVLQWFACDNAQLIIYIRTNNSKTLHIGDILYRVNGGFMNDENVPTVELINVKTSSVQYVPLSLIDVNYINYSAIPREEQIKLLAKLNITR